MRLPAAALLLLPLLLSPLRAADDPERPVVPEALIKLIEKADRLVVKESPQDDARTLYQTMQKDDIDALARVATVEKPENPFECACEGTPAIYLYHGNELVGSMTNHHGRRLRCTLWYSDASLTNEDGWLNWFSDRGMKEPRNEYEELKRLGEEGEKAARLWKEATPAAIKPLWEKSLGAYGKVDTPPLLAALKAAVPRKKDQIRALLGWFGSGEGPWSGYSAYESAPEEMLMTYSIKDILHAIDTAPLSDRETEGAARYFSGWDFSEKFPDGRKQVPAALKATLWEHVKGTKNEDKLDRARSAFAPEEEKEKKE